MRTTQNRKRSRSSGGGYGNKRRRIFKRARRARDRVNTNFTRPQARTRTRLTRRKKRLYKRNLWIATTAMQKYRVAGSSSETIATPASLNSYTVKDYRVWRHPQNVTDAANWIDDSGDRTLTVAGNFFVWRGGEWKLTLAHENAENVAYRVEMVYHKNNGSLITGTFDKSIVGNNGNDASNEVTVLKTWEGMISPSSSVYFSHKIGITKVDRNRSENYRDQLGFLVYVGNTVTASAVDVTAILTINGHVCGDIITAT